MKNILERIQIIVESEGIKITSLEREIGASKGVLSRAINNGTDIQSKWLSKIVENYPQYSTEWLLTGKGHMLKNDQQSTVTETSKQSDIFKEYVKATETIADLREEIGSLKTELNNLRSQLDYNKNQVAS